MPSNAHCSCRVSAKDVSAGCLLSVHGCPYMANSEVSIGTRKKRRTSLVFSVFFFKYFFYIRKLSPCSLLGRAFSEQLNAAFIVAHFHSECVRSVLYGNISFGNIINFSRPRHMRPRVRERNASLCTAHIRFLEAVRNFSSCKTP